MKQWLNAQWTKWRFPILIGLIVLLIGMLVGPTILKQNVISKKDAVTVWNEKNYEPWFSPGTKSGRVGLLNKTTGEFFVMSDSLTKNFMMGQLKMYYTDEWLRIISSKP